MEEKFDHYFSNQNHEYRRNYSYRFLFRDIEDAARDANISLRSDAEYFLVTNIINMVLAPMHPADERYFSEARFPLPYEGLRDLLREDISSILKEAARVAEQRERSEISGTTILKALANKIEDLRISGTQLWGPRATPLGRSRY